MTGSDEIGGEIDLRNILSTIWENKKTVLISTLIVFLCALIYAFAAQEQWSSKARVTLPQFKNIASLNRMIKQYQPFFEQRIGNEAVNSHELDKFLSSSELFNTFVSNFNSNDNKRSFIENSSLFANVQLDNESVYINWFEKIKAVTIERNNNNIYELLVQANNKENSLDILKGYISYINAIVYDSITDNLKVIVDGKKHELEKEKQILLYKAREKLSSEILRAEYELRMAKSSGVDRPFQNLSNDKLFSINIGSKAIEEKLKILKSLTDLSIMEPKLQELDSRIRIFSEIKTNISSDIKVYKFITEPKPSINRDSPRRSLIVILGALFGVFIGIFIVFIRRWFESNSNNK